MDSGADGGFAVVHRNGDQPPARPAGLPGARAKARARRDSFGGRAPHRGRQIPHGIGRGLPGDAGRLLALEAGSRFDRILVDAPCTGLGTLHRNPEAKWNRKEGDPRRLQNLQLALLQNVSSHLKPGGVLVYSTCTLTAEENDEVVDSFLRKNGDYVREDLHSVFPSSWYGLLDEKGFYRTYPAAMIQDAGYRMDGFFAARMRKK